MAFQVADKVIVTCKGNSYPRKGVITHITHYREDHSTKILVLCDGFKNAYAYNESFLKKDTDGFPN
jgi:hypothetical protein